MSLEVGLVLAVSLAAIVLFVREWIAPDGVALLAIVVLLACGLLDTDEAFQAFGNEALVTVAAMFVLSAAITRTGAVGFIARQILARGGRSEVPILVAIMVAAALCSAAINNTPVAVIFLPLVIRIAESSGISGSKLLIPMSYATIAGGMCTVIGTSTNVLVSSLLPRFGMPSLPLFAPLPLALVGIAITIAYMALIGRRLLPDRGTASATIEEGKIKDYLSEVHVPPGSRLAGSPLADALLAKSASLRVLQLIRRGMSVPLRRGRALLREGDTLLVKGDVNDLLALRRMEGIDVAPELDAADSEVQPRKQTLVELLVRPPTVVIGSRVGDLNLRDRYGVTVLALQRHGTDIRQKVADVRLRLGDVLLVQASVEDIARLRRSEDLMVLEGVEEQILVPHKAWISLTAVAAVVLLAAAGIFPVSLLALAGALVVVGSGCLSVRDAYRAVDLPILVLMAGTIALGLAMEKSGAARWIAGGIIGAARPFGDLALLSGIYLICNVLTAIASNAGAALITLPIALEAARQGGLRPEPFVLAVMFAASIDFSTPIGYQTNTFVYGPGGYRFMDYVKVGGPLNLIWWGVATLLIPVFWPLR